MNIYRNYQAQQILQLLKWYIVISVILLLHKIIITVMNLFTKEKLINLLTSGKEFKDQRLLHFHYARTHTKSEARDACKLH